MIWKKGLLILILLCIGTGSFGQVDKPYSKTFEPGKITKTDGTELSGLINFFISHGGKVKFKATEQSEETKYAPAELKGFQIGDDHFELFDTLTIIGQAGIKTKLRNCFGQLLERGKISVYLIYFVAPDPFGGSNVYYLNFWLIKTIDNKSRGFAVPYNQRLKAGKIDKVKNELKGFINDSRVFERVDSMRREGGLAETVEIVKQYNSTTD